MRLGIAIALTLALASCAETLTSGLSPPPDAGLMAPMPDAGPPPPPPPDSGIPIRPDGGLACSDDELCDGGPPEPSVGSSDGAPCTDDRECAGGRCFRAPEWPGGYCTTPDCFFSQQCHPGARGARCAALTVPAPHELACLEECRSIADCRPGYACVPIDLGHRGCVPDVARPIRIDPPDSYPFEVSCGATPIAPGRSSFTFEVPEGATSYMITPIARDGRHVAPVAIDLPSGGRIDFTAENAFQTLTPIFRPFVAPTLIPSVSQLAGQLEAGLHTYTLDSSSTDVCWQLVTEQSDGVELDLRIYFAGARGLDAAGAPENADLQEVLAHTASLLAQVGLTLSDVVYRDLDPADAERHSIIRTRAQIGELVALSERGTGDLDSELVLNVFFVDAIAFGGGGVLGVASALPGPAALHGTEASGVIATAEAIGFHGGGPLGQPSDGNAFTALVLAHEIGHFLGLLHTSELGADPRTFDPVLDTPECDVETQLHECPDLGNVMFPFADPGNVALTPGQGYTMSKNPLSKEPR